MFDILLCSFSTFDSAIDTFDGRSHNNMFDIQQQNTIDLCIALLNQEKIIKN